MLKFRGFIKIQYPKSNNLGTDRVIFVQATETYSGQNIDKMNYKTSYQSKVNVYAVQLRRHDKSLTWSQALKAAHAFIKSTADARLLIMRKKDGSIARRIVAQRWSDYYTPKGGKSNRKPGLMLFADLNRVAVNPAYPIISAYEQNIIALAA